MILVHKATYYNQSLWVIHWALGVFLGGYHLQNNPLPLLSQIDTNPTLTPQPPITSPLQGTSQDFNSPMALMAHTKSNLVDMT